MFKNKHNKGDDNKNKSKGKDMKKNKKRGEADSDEDSDMYETYSESESEESEDDSDYVYVAPKSKKNKKNTKRHKTKKYYSDEEDDIDINEIDHHYIQKLVSRILPSKYYKDKVKETEKKLKNHKYNTRHHKKKRRASITSEEEEEDDDDDYYYDDEEEEDEDEYEDEEEEDEEEDDEDDDDDDDDEVDDEDEQVFNIVLLGGADGNQEEEYIDDNAECDSDDEKAFMKENFESDSKDDSTKEDASPSKQKKNKKHKADEDNEIVLTDVEQEYLDLVETKKSLQNQLDKRPNSKVLKKAISDCKHSIMKLVKKARNKNAKTYHKLIHNDKKKENEIDYFKKKLSNKEQLRVMKDFKEVNKHINIDKPYRLALLDSNIPPNFKAVAMQRLNVLRNMEPGDPEYYKIKNWVDTFMRIPFGVYRNLSVNINDGIDMCHQFMANAKERLDNCVYGLDDAKLQIMQMMGQWISNPSAMGTAIAIKGPMGTGKTTLVKEGISKILGREFAFIALGGNSDSSFLEGHSYTYEGSTWGKIIQILIDSKCMNPVIYFDELDKVSDTAKGEEIIGILTHLTDTTQNSQFHDKYFSEVDFDLSKCLFIFSYNDESKINPILRDRMYRIQTNGYESKEKLVIARKHLLPTIREQVNFKEEDIIIPDETINYINSSEHLTNKEQGVRNLKRCLEIIYTKLNLFRLTKKETKLFEKDMDIEVTFPVTVTQKMLDTLIKNDKNINQSLLAMYI
tara:strand:- start:740 stop:2953 length:2214 start_codon:yes stop_codon:yes gene_type:complete